MVLLSAGQKICRRGTERPCYKVSYIHDSRRRLTFEDASRACRVEGGELLSIETESEQRLIERFIHQLQAADGDFWIGLRRSPERHPAGVSSVCPSQYYWLDGSKAKYRFLSPIGQFVKSSQLTQGTNLSLVLLCFFKYFPKGTGTGTSRLVVGKCVWFCTISHRRHLTKTVASCSSGMTTTATPRTTLSANIQRVSQRLHESELGTSLMYETKPPHQPDRRPALVQIHLSRQSEWQAFVQNHNASTGFTVVHSLTSGADALPCRQLLT